MSILDVTETPFKDDSIEEYEYFEYLPIVGDVNKLNNTGDIAINIETQDIFMHPSESYLLIEGRLVKNVNPITPYADEDIVTLANNGLMYLFSNIRYDLSGKEIERIAHPGWATTMLGLLKYDDDFSKSRGLNQLWYKDTSRRAAIEGNNANSGLIARHDLIIKKPDPKGAFEFRIPLKHIFGFCEVYDKVLFGMKQTLYLTRAGNDDAIYKAEVTVDGAGNNRHQEGKVILEKIAWYMPHVLPTDKYKMELYKHIQNKGTFLVNYRMIQCDTTIVPQALSFTWRLAVKTSPEFPHYIIIGFQKDRQTDPRQDKNPAIFDHVNVTDIHVTLNSFKYPRTDYKLSFEAQKFSRAYGDVSEFRSKFFLMDDLASNPNFTPLEYKDLYPLFLFDVSKQSERIKYGITDIHVKANFNDNIADNTHAYAVILSDRVINFQSDGNKMSVVY